MKLAAAQSLTAWLWAEHPGIIEGISARMPRPLGDCFSCGIDWLSGASCQAGIPVSGVCFGTTDPNIALDPVSLDPSALCVPELDIGGCAAGGVCIPTLNESDLTPVNTNAVTGGCNIPIGTGCAAASGTSVTSTDAATSSALSGVAGFLTSSAGLTALTRAASAYFNAQAASSQAAATSAALQAAVVNAQTARAVAGQSALPVKYVANGATGTTAAVISTKGGAVPLTSSILAAFTPSSLAVFFAQYGTWVLIGGAAAFLAYAATRRRKLT